MAKESLEAMAKALRQKDEIRVLFVCLGNICRSPAAEGVMRALVEERETGGRRRRRWVIDSAGIGGWHVGDLPDRRMRVHARERGLELTHLARQVRRADFDDFDLIIGMDSQNILDLRHLAPTVEAEAKITSMMDWTETEHPGYDHVPDPYYEGSEGFELVLDLLQDACEGLYRRLS